MRSKSQLNLLKNLLKLPDVEVKDYQLTESIGLVIFLENSKNQVTCPFCGTISKKLHQNHWHLIRDLPWNEHQVYLRLNRRQFKCNLCGKPFSEEFDFVKKRKKYTKRLITRITQEINNSNPQGVAQRHGLTEKDIEKILTKNQRDK